MVHPARKNISSLKLAFVGEANWDIYVDDSGTLWSLAKPECPSCEDSYFGDKHHIKRLMQQGAFSYKEVTEIGLTMLSGLCHKLITPSNGKPWALLTFSA